MMLDDNTATLVKTYFAEHPVLGTHASGVCIALTGSFAVGLGGKGADVDAKVLCPPAIYDALRREGNELEEEFPTVVGDYSLESLSDVWAKVQDYSDMTPLFVYGSLVYLAGDKTLLDPLVQHCRAIPSTVLERERERERGSMGQALYAFLRSFQNDDGVARLLARAELVRAAMRLTFLADGSAPPYDKHLFRLLPQTAHGAEVAELIRRFLGEPSAAAYEAVGDTSDWHEMYRVAADTPALQLHGDVLRIIFGNTR
ncbi:MAG TPA: hypothetical protein VNT75_20865 [Symbiobacteriaceae bacterium]|nr:hypothetical protein [Symbiobacteriaceae bacterium]